MTKIENRDNVNWKDNLLLVANDKIEYEIPKAMAYAASTHIKDMVDVNDDDKKVHLVNCANGKTIADLVSFIGHHDNNPPTRIQKPLRVSLDKALSNWDMTFVKGLMKDDDYTQLRALAIAATTLQVPKLVEVLAATYASILKGKTTAEMRSILKMEKGYTDEEEERIRNDGPWPGVDDVDDDGKKKDTKEKK
eukprot:Tbor_TRINITY_DN5883_c1_g1::TRINITY_DN5883_c1_g1_i1::g.6501::m.6501/K03094/SKP1, CBF3D; S-phase kinase-associated protein 1